MATETIQTCRECCGGAGYLSVNRFAALKPDSDIFTTFEGDNTVLMQLVAKGLLTGYKAEFGALNPVELVTLRRRRGSRAGDRAAVRAPDRSGDRRRGQSRRRR